MKTEQLAAILLKHPGLDVVVAETPDWAVAEPLEDAGIGYVESLGPVTDTIIPLYEEEEIRDDDSAIPPVFRKVFVLTPQF